MTIVFDARKRQVTLQERGLDMARAGEIFEGATLTETDDRFAYDEIRNITIGYLDGRMVVVVWTQRGRDQRIIRLRKANDREQARYGWQLDRPG